MSRGLTLHREAFAQSVLLLPFLVLEGGMGYVYGEEGL